MPTIAAWIDAMVEAFGKEEIHGQIRQGLTGAPTFFASENGHMVGTPVTTGARYRVIWDQQDRASIDEMEDRHG